MNLIMYTTKILLKYTMLDKDVCDLISKFACHHVQSFWSKNVLNFINNNIFDVVDKDGTNLVIYLCKLEDIVKLVTIFNPSIIYYNFKKNDTLIFETYLKKYSMLKKIPNLQFYVGIDVVKGIIENEKIYEEYLKKTKPITSKYIIYRNIEDINNNHIKKYGYSYIGYS